MQTWQPHKIQSKVQCSVPLHRECHHGQHVPLGHEAGRTAAYVTHSEVVVAHPSVLVVGVVNALPAGEQQLLVG